jgi:hypothetical protein
MAKKWSIDTIKFPRNRSKNHAIIFAKNLGINEVADPELYYYVIKWYVETNPGNEFPISDSEYDEFEEDSLDGDFGKVHDKVLKEVEKYQKEQKKNKKPIASKRPPKAPSKKPTAPKRTTPPAQPQQNSNDEDEETKDKIEELLGEIKRAEKQQRRQPTPRSARRFVQPSKPRFRTRNVNIGRAITQRSRVATGGGNGSAIGPTGASSVLSGGGNDPIIQILLKIQKSVDNILASLSSQKTITVKTQRITRITEEQKRRQEAESALESSAKKTYVAFEKVISPVKGILDRIFDFIFYTLLGKAFTEVVKWISDPQNKKKIESLKRFFKDWWPAILGTFILFGTRFGKFVRSTVGLVVNLTKYIRAIGIPGILKLLKTFGVRSLYAGAAVAAAYGGYQLLKPKEEQDQARKLKPEEPKKQENQRTRPQPLPPSYAFRRGGMIPQRNQSNAIGIEQIATGGSGQITRDSGLNITGAGPDTQLVAARPGEIVLTPEDAKKVESQTGLNLYKFVSGRNPKFANNIQLANQGGVVGPKLTPADYNSLLAISALEDTTPQGRADVAQSIYNRLQASNAYGANFNQSKNSIKDIILAPKQYEPIFNNIKDWSNINDRKSAAVAVMNSTKGKKYGWNMQAALKEMSDTEKALKNIKLQQQAQRFIGTRTAFYGVSQQEYMRPDKGDVLRNPNANFFVSQGNYGNKPAPIPVQFQAPPAPPKPKPKGFLERSFDSLLQFTGIKKSEATLVPSSPDIKQPGPRVARQGTVTFTEIPVATAKPMSPASTGGAQIPAFSAKSPLGDREVTLRAYGLA